METRILVHMDILDHLKSRHLDTNLHTAWINQEEQCATFPCWNLSGQMTGYQIYRPNKGKKKNNNPYEGRYFIRKTKGVVSVWGLESWNLSNVLFLTEGIFDAARLTGRGYSAVALFSNDIDSMTRMWLWIVQKMRPVVSICDNDSAGMKMKKYGHSYHVVEDAKDLSESDDEYVTNLLKEYEKWK